MLIVAVSTSLKRAISAARASVWWVRPWLAAVDCSAMAAFCWVISPILPDREVDLAQGMGLVAGRLGDRGDRPVDLGHLADHLVQRPAGLADQGGAGLHLARGGGDQGLDLLGRGGGALGQGPHLAGHDRKAPPGLAPPAPPRRPAFRANRLVWKAISSITPMIWPISAEERLHPAHGRHRPRHHLAAAVDIDPGVGHQAPGAAGALGGTGDGAGPHGRAPRRRSQGSGACCSVRRDRWSDAWGQLAGGRGDGLRRRPPPWPAPAPAAPRRCCSRPASPRNPWRKAW